MAKFQKLNSMIARLEARLDELEAQGIDITKLGDPVKQAETRARWAASAKKRAAKQEKAKVAAVATAAATWTIGDAIVTRRGERGVVTAIEGSVLAIDVAGVSRKFAAAMVRAA